jgi:hypothetical protein
MIKTYGVLYGRAGRAAAVDDMVTVMVMEARFFYLEWNQYTGHNPYSHLVFGGRGRRGKVWRPQKELVYKTNRILTCIQDNKWDSCQLGNQFQI